jgi:hypothetical protein
VLSRQGHPRRHYGTHNPRVVRISSQRTSKTSVPAHSKSRKELLHLPIHLRHELVDRILVFLDRDAENRVSVPASDNEDAYAPRVVAMSLPLARSDEDVTGIDLFTVAGLRMSDDKSDIA